MGQGPGGLWALMEGGRLILSLASFSQPVGPWKLEQRVLDTEEDTLSQELEWKQGPPGKVLWKSFDPAPHPHGVTLGRAV